MTSEDRAKLESIFRVVLDLPDTASVAGLRRLTCGAWDSLAQVSLIAAIESEFDLRLDSDHTARLTSFEGAKLLVEELRP